MATIAVAPVVAVRVVVEVAEAGVEDAVTSKMKEQAADLQERAPQRL